MEEALKKCVEEKLYSANDFRDVVSYLKQQSKGQASSSIDSLLSSGKRIDVQVETRPMSAYTSILGGNAS